jgi:penicillin-binding protein A
MRWRMRTQAPPGQRPDWRQYQAMLQKGRPALLLVRWKAAVAIAAVVTVVLIISIAAYRSPDVTADKAAPQPTEPELINRADAQLLLEKIDPAAFTAKHYSIPFQESQLQVRTTLDEDLQARLVGALDRKNSRYVGIVVMEADSGRVLAMVGFDKTETEGNPCLSNIFPAASIFKIVTAAAAIERCGFNSDTRLFFNGYKHTLYKRQITEKKDRWTNEIAFKDSFAQSVNPVFGKIGALRLGREVLDQYAHSFGFNQPIAFELPVQPSHIALLDEPYHLAEIASGFNRQTTISPLHGAVIAAAVLNDGRMITPTIVDSIVDSNGNRLYDAQAVWNGQAMSPQAAATLARLMEATVRSGTARRTFRGIERNRGLGNLDIGGKTGSISTRQNDARFDWFVGYAREKAGSGGLAISVVVAHEQFIGRRATEYARMAITHYFSRNTTVQSKSLPGTGS